MDWLRQLPLGQYVAGRRGWLRRLDPRLKYAWSLAFLLTPILASAWWRLALVALLLLITLASGLPLAFVAPQRAVAAGVELGGGAVGRCVALAA